jgi:hypothetical protein
VVTLLPDTYYVICGLVNIGPNRIECPPNSVIAGKDPLVDTITAQTPPFAPIRPLITFRLGGTIRDLAVIWPVRDAAIVFGAAGDEAVAPRCVAWNLSISGARDGIALLGDIEAVTISRINCQGLDSAVIQPPFVEVVEAIGALYLSEIASIGNPASSRQVRLQGRGKVLACSALVFFDGAGSVGVDISGQWDVLQFWGCAYFATGTPSQIIDASTGATETTGTATQSEAAAMVGYTNSTTRGSISLFGGSLQPNPGAGTYAPIGFGIIGYPLFALSGSSVRCALGGGPTADLQTLEYIGARPYVADISVSCTVGTGTGFITASRTFGVRLLKNGAVLPGATWEGGLAPGAIAVTSSSVSFSVPDTLSAGDQLKIEIANLTDGAQLVVTGAQIVIS